MQQGKTPQQAIEFIFNSIRNIDPNNTKITKEDVKDLFDELFEEKIEQVASTYLNDIDRNIISENIDNNDFINNYFAQRIPKYHEMISDTISEIVEEYTIDEELPQSSTQL